MITLYGKHNCGSCEMVKTKLARKSIEYEYINLDDMEDRAAADSIEQLAISAGILTLPIIMVDGDVVEFKDVLTNVS